MSFARLELSPSDPGWIGAAAQPAIAVLAGEVLPLEYERALECALIVIDANAALAMPRGACPQLPLTLRNLSLRVGEGAAWRFWFGDGLLEARAAAASRLVDEIDDEPNARARVVLERWAAYPDATRGLAELLRVHASVDEASGLRLESARFALLFSTADTRSAICRFLDRSR